MEKIPHLDINLDIEKPICIPHNNNAFQALRRALKPAKVTKTQALFHLRQHQILVCLPYIGPRLKSTWPLLTSRLADWLIAMFD